MILSFFSELRKIKIYFDKPFLFLESWTYLSLDGLRWDLYAAQYEALEAQREGNNRLVVTVVDAVVESLVAPHYRSPV